MEEMSHIRPFVVDKCVVNDGRIGSNIGHQAAKRLDLIGICAVGGKKQSGGALFRIFPIIDVSFQIHLQKSVRLQLIAGTESGWSFSLWGLKIIDNRFRVLRYTECCDAVSQLKKGVQIYRKVLRTPEIVLLSGDNRNVVRSELTNFTLNSILAHSTAFPASKVLMLVGTAKVVLLYL